MDSPRQKLHPMLWIAAASVTAASLAGIAKLSGVLPQADTPAAAHVELAPPPPAIPPAPIAEAPLAAPAAAPIAEAPREAVPAPRPTAKKPPPPHPVAKAPAPAPATLEAAPTAPPAPTRPELADLPPPPPPPQCHDCGVIENIRTQEIKGEGSGLGAIGGALLGGVLGHQVGEGSGKQIARIGGAVLGGFAGNEVERRERATTRYDITVRLDDGTRRVISGTQAPAWRQGQRVRVRNGEILPAPSMQPPPANF